MQHTTQHLIIGATGKTGSRVIRGLRAKGYQPIAAGRQSERQFDWQAPETWAPALNGIGSVYLTYYPDLAVPQAPEDISQFCALAKLKGINHLTLLSGRGEPAAQVCENIVKQSGLSYTIIRASWFNQNFSEGLFRGFIDQGDIALPVDAVTEPFVDIDDIAEIAVASLIDSRHSNKLYEVTGPELLSFAQLAQSLTTELNLSVKFTTISLTEFQQRLQQAGVEPGAIEMLSYLFTEVLDGRNEYITDGIQQALGRPATSFAQFLDRNHLCFKEIA